MSQIAAMFLLMRNRGGFINSGDKSLLLLFVIMLLVIFGGIFAVLHPGDAFETTEKVFNVEEKHNVKPNYDYLLITLAGERYYELTYYQHKPNIKPNQAYWFRLQGRKVIYWEAVE